MRWCEDFRNVLKLARCLIDNCQLCTAQECYDYFSESWKWDAEWQAMIDSEGPTNADIDAAMDFGRTIDQHVKH